MCQNPGGPGNGRNRVDAAPARRHSCRRHRRLQPAHGRGRGGDGPRPEGPSGRDPPPDRPPWRPHHRHGRRRHPGRVSQRDRRHRMRDRDPGCHGHAQRDGARASPDAVPNRPQPGRRDPRRSPDLRGRPQRGGPARGHRRARRHLRLAAGVRAGEPHGEGGVPGARPAPLQEHRAAGGRLRARPPPMPAGAPARPPPAAST